LNIRLNKNTGQFDFDMLANYFDQDNLVEWGFEHTEFAFIEEPSEEELTEDSFKNNPPQMTITFDNAEQLQNAEIEIQDLLNRKYEGAYFSVKAGEI